MPGRLVVIAASATWVAMSVGAPGCSQGPQSGPTTPGAAASTSAGGAVGNADAGGATGGGRSGGASGSVGLGTAGGASSGSGASSTGDGADAGASGAASSGSGSTRTAGGSSSVGSGSTSSAVGLDASPPGAGADGASDGGLTEGGGATVDGGPGQGVCVSPVTATATDFGKVFADAVIAHGFGTFASASYPVGLFMHGLYKVYLRTKDPRYLTFLTTWANANSATPSGTSVDEIMHMTAVADAYALSMNANLVAPLKATRKIFDTYPRTSDGAFWHRTTATGQNWGDTSFMALSFLTRYGTVMNDSTTYAEGVKQITLFASHLKNPATGLLFHAYDETGAAPWIVPGTHHSPETWGRAMGWYLMATVMVLEELPADDPGRPQVEAILKGLVASLKGAQDAASGRWFQVVDKGSLAGNWLETSASAMYSYVTFWAATRGLVDSSYCDVARRGFEGVMQEVSSDPSKLITGVCEGTGVGNFAYYVGRNHTQFNDFHGIGSFLLMWEGMR